MDRFSVYHPSIPSFLADAAQTAPMQRLKGVGMNCGCEYTSFPLFSRGYSYSRFDHSLGAALITWHFTRQPRQAMAALLHDIATPVFSHVVDFLRGDYLTQEATEEGTERMILESEELKRVCEGYDIDPRDVVDYHRYPIADNDSPRLSADRLEYTLGNIYQFGFGDLQTVCGYYSDLQAGEEELMFRHEETACAFAADALRCGQIYVCDEDRYAMQILAEILKEGLEKGVLTPEDLYRQEHHVVRKLENASLAGAWREFCQMNTLRRCEEADPGARKIYAKKRYIDPMVISGRRASEIDGSFARSLTRFLETDFGYYVTSK